MKYKTQFILTPALLFILIWSVVLFMHIKFNPFSFVTMKEFTMFVVIASVLFFIMGFGIVDSTYDRQSPLNQKIIINENLLSRFIIIVSVMVWIGIIMNIKSLGSELGGLELYLKNPFKVRGKIVELTESNIENYNVLYSFGNYITSLNYPLTVLGGILFTVKSRLRFIGLMPIIQGLFISLITLGRFSAMTTLGYWFLAFYYSSFMYDPKSTRKLMIRILTSGIFLMVILGIFFFMIIRIRTFYLKNINDLFIKSIYTYFVGPVSALDVFIASDVKYMYGASAFRSIIKWLARFGFWEAQDVLKTNNPFVSIGSFTSINTFSFIKTFYEDFGILGVISGSMIWGGITRYLGEKVISKFNFSNLFLFIIITFSLIMSFYAFYFEGLSAIILYFVFMKIFDDYLIKKSVYLIN